MMAPSRQAALFFLLAIYIQDSVVQTQATCAVKFSQFAADHTACLTTDRSVSPVGASGVSSPVKNVDISDAQKNEIVNYHNKKRAGVSPSAIDMLKMTWDDEIAAIATKWAKQCNTKPGTRHDKSYQRYIPNRFALGQNMASRGGGHNVLWTLAMKMWADEANDFTYGEGHTDPNNPKVFAHWTQMIWAKTNKIGCGHAFCPDGTTVYICNYGPAGNVAGATQATAVTPYANGTTKGSQCQAKTTSPADQEDLCDCGTMECDNWGKMNVNTCTCECKDAPWFTDDSAQCSINCTKISEEPIQCAWYGTESCFDYANWPATCPQTCRQCVNGTSAATQTTVSTTTAARLTTAEKTTTTAPETTTAAAATTVRVKTTTTTTTTTTAATPASGFNPILFTKFPTICYITDNGTDYNGTNFLTESGKTCQRWNMQSPHSHHVTDASMSSYGLSLERSENYCRNPPGHKEARPWCYTTDQDTRWEYCTVPKCTATCTETELAYEYAGTLDVTEDGITCAAWADQTDYTAQFMPEQTLADAKNYCRNPEEGYEDGLWCFTIDGSWDFCNMPMCPTTSS